MKQYIAMILSLLIFFSCNGKNSDKVLLNIINRSSQKIDSVIIPYANIKVAEIKVGDSDKIEVNISGVLRPTGKGEFPIYIFQNGKKIKTTWGFHDWGMFAKKNEYIYLFDNGVNSTDENLIKPKFITLYIGDMTYTKIDSIQVTSVLSKEQYNASAYGKIELDFEKFEQSPEIKVYQQGKIYNIHIDHDWKDWNNTQEFIYIYNNGVASKKDRSKRF